VLDAAGEGAYLLRIRRAGWWRRFFSALIDGIVLAIVQAILRVLVGDTGGISLGLLVDIAYFTYFHGSTGQTPGDMALSIKVVDLRDGTGQPIGYGRAFIRWLGSILSAIPLFLGYFWMLWDPEKQTWHDKIAGSAVVDLNDHAG
jgi:uncharacterized RDD family membrane protein YckC